MPAPQGYSLTFITPVLNCFFATAPAYNKTKIIPQKRIATFKPTFAFFYNKLEGVRRFEWQINTITSPTLKLAK
jgi:hypothetical protein